MVSEKVKSVMVDLVTSGMTGEEMVKIPASVFDEAVKPIVYIIEDDTEILHEVLGISKDRDLAIRLEIEKTLYDYLENPYFVGHKSKSNVIHQLSLLANNVQELGYIMFQAGSMMALLTAPAMAEDGEDE